MKGVIPIIHIKGWESDAKLTEFCEHIISHSDRYERERVFEAKTVLNNLKGKSQDETQKMPQMQP